MNFLKKKKNFLVLTRTKTWLVLIKRVLVIPKILINFGDSWILGDFDNKLNLNLFEWWLYNTVYS
jgi:hypothetical protein